MTEDDAAPFKAPYPAFKTFTNFLERLQEKGMPPKIDRSYLTWLSGLGQSQLLATLRAFGLIDESGNVTDDLRSLVESVDERPARIALLLRSNYSGAVELGKINATQAQLEEEFKQQYKLTGSTLRKAIAFYLNACEYAGVQKSANWKTPRERTTTAKPRKPQQRNATKAGATPKADVEEDTTTVADPKQRYLDLLLDKASEDLDEKLLDRIERLLGYEDATSTEPANKE